MGPKCAILCSGKSVESFDPSGFDLIFAVNTSMWMFESDYAGCIDEFVMRDKRVIRPRIGFIGKPHIDPLIFISGTRLHKDEFCTGTEDFYDDMLCMCLYTMPAILWEALRLSNGGELHVFGNDYTLGNDIFDMGECARSPQRWIQEIPWVRCIAPGAIHHGNMNTQLNNFLYMGTGWN